MLAKVILEHCLNNYYPVYTEISRVTAHGPLKWSIGKSGGWAVMRVKNFGGRLFEPRVRVWGGRLNGPWALTCDIFGILKG